MERGLERKQIKTNDLILQYFIEVSSFEIITNVEM